MITCDVNKQGPVCIVSADGGLTIEHAAELKAAFVKALGSGMDIAMDFSRVTDADLSCIQLVCSMCKSTRSLGVNAFMDVTSEAFERRVVTGGFGDLHCDLSDRCPVAGGGHE